MSKKHDYYQHDDGYQEPETISPDADLANSDWTKGGASWDLPPYKSPEFMAMYPDLDAFRKLPAYQGGINAGLICDDEWIGPDSTPAGKKPARPKEK